MTLHPSLAERVERYLAAVEQHLKDKSPEVRQEVVAGLRDHIMEALRRAQEEGAEEEALDRILAEMDPPESYSESDSESGDPAVARAASATSSPWFWLALAFLFVNAYGVWKWIHPQAPLPPTPPESVSTQKPAPPSREIVSALRLQSVEQVDLSSTREATVRLIFTDAPDLDLLSRFLRLTADRQTEIPYRILGRARSETVLIQTDPVRSDRLHYEVRPGLPSAGEANPTDRTQRAHLSLRPSLEFRRLEARSPSFEEPMLVGEFTVLPESDGVERYVAIEPAVSYTVEAASHWRGGGIRIRGEFEPGGVYSVTFKEGLRAANGSVLLESITRRVQFPQRAPALRFQHRGRYLAPAGQLLVPIEGVNIEEWTASLRPVFANNLVHLALRETGASSHWGPLTRSLTGPTVVQTNQWSAPPNRQSRGFVQLRALAPSEPRGVYWLEVGAPKASGEGRLVVVTDLGIAARAYEGGLLVWVNSLQTATPIADVLVTAYAENNQPIGDGFTDEQGLVRIDLTEGERPFLITAQREGDLSYIDLRRTRVGQGTGLSGAPYLKADELEAAVFSERGVYRPGETAFLQALVRDNQMEAPRPFPVLFRVRRPDGRVYRDLSVMLDEFGAASATVELPDFLPTGRYTMELAMPGTHTLLGQTTVALEDFVPPQIRVDLLSPRDRLVGGTALTFGVRSEYLFGRPAGGLPASGFATVKAVAFAPRQWPDWRFGDDEKTFAPIYLQLGSQTLDAEGHTSFTVETLRAWRPPAALQVVQQASVMEAGGRAVTAYGATDLDLYPFYIGLRRTGEGAMRVGEPERVQIVQITPDGEPVAEGKPLALALYAVQWNSVLRRNAQGQYEWRSEKQQTLVQEDTIAAGGEPTEWTFTPNRTGEFALVARDPASGASTRIHLRAASHEHDWVEWSRERPGRVELSWDRERYRPGDTAQLTVKAPFRGTALLTIESDHVREARVVTLAENTATIDIPVLAAYAPNVYCALTIIRPADAGAEWNPHRAVGAVVLPVERPNTQLVITLKAPQTQTPLSRLTTSLRVLDENEEPVRGKVTLMAVDEGICMLTAFETPDPNRTFNAQRRLGITAFDLYHELMPLVDESLIGVTPPGGDAGDALRRRLSPIRAARFRPVALWQSDVALDSDGRAVIDLDIPEFTGALRLMAVAYNATQAGSADAKVEIKRDWIVQPALPRFLALGDRNDASLLLMNESDSPIEAVVRIDCEGPLQSDVSEETVTLSPGASHRLAFTLTAGPAPDKAVCTLHVQVGDQSFHEAVEIPVRPAGGLHVHTSNQVLEPGARVTLSPPADWLPATLSQVGAISALPALNWSRALEYVVQYPYGCLEQTVSGAFPFLHSSNWEERLLPGPLALGDPAQHVRAAILRVLSMQQAGGGFSLWPFANTADSTASLYAAHFLVEAQAAGYEVLDDRFEAALRWLRDRLDRTVHMNADEPAWLDDMDERAYACHVLALAGRPDHGWNARLADQFDRLFFASQIHTASALLLSGTPRQAWPLLEAMPQPAPRARIPGRILNSDIREAALLLSAWLDADPSHEQVDQLAHYLNSRQQDGHWGNTQDNAMALLAFGKYEQRRAQAPRDFRGAITQADSSERDFSHEEDMQWTVEQGSDLYVTIVNHGPGSAYLMVRYEGVSPEPEPEKSHGVAIRRDFLDLAGAPLDPSTRRQGDLVIVRLQIDPMNRRLDHLVIEDLLPAGWEIENPNLATAHRPAWLSGQVLPTRFTDLRDDRLLLFTGQIATPQHFYYTVRAVSPGEYRYPPVVVSGMYEPEIRAVSGGGIVRVLE